MSHQFSKRSRERRKVDRALAVVEGCMIVRDDGRLWVQRPVDENSGWELENSARNLGNLKDIRKAGKYTLSILYHREVLKAAKKSPKRYVGIEGLDNALIQAWPKSLNSPINANVTGIQQFNRWVSLTIDYPEFDRERAVLTSAVSEFLGVSNEWREGKAHISLGMGWLATLGEPESILNALPPRLNLLDAKSGF